MRAYRRIELGPGNPVREVWLYDDGSATIGDVQYGRLVDGIHLDAPLVDALVAALAQRRAPETPGR